LATVPSGDPGGLELGAASGRDTLEEAVSLRERGIRARMLLLESAGKRLRVHRSGPDRCVVSRVGQATAVLGEPAAHPGAPQNQYRHELVASLERAAGLIELICSTPSLLLEGVLSHFAQSDEADKTFALLQLSRFQEVLDHLAARGVPVKFRHLCNSGGFLELPQAHFDMVRLGILPLGVFPSSVCRRIPGIEAVMTSKPALPLSKPAARRQRRLWHAL
jgi:alanine racemase